MPIVIRMPVELPLRGYRADRASLLTVRREWERAHPDKPVTSEDELLSAITRHPSTVSISVQGGQHSSLTLDPYHRTARAHLGDGTPDPTVHFRPLTRWARDPHGFHLDRRSTEERRHSTNVRLAVIGLIVAVAVGIVTILAQ